MISGGPRSPGASGGVLTFGETMALLRSDGQTPLSQARQLELGIGGAESNVAIGLRRLGAPATWIGRVGNDSLGLLIARELRAEDVDARIVIDGGAPTGLMIKERRMGTTVSVSYYRTASAGSRLSPGDISQECIRASGVLHLTGITPALSASALAAVRMALEVARAAHVAVSFDLNYRRALWSPEDAAACYREIIPQADIVFAGDDEAAIALGRGGGACPDELAAGLAELGPGEAVIKLGERGAVASIDGVLHRQPAIPIVAVDTVGAGDAFVAGYLAETLLGHTAAERLATAAAAGAGACLSPGDWEGLPRRADLRALEVSPRVLR